MSHTVSRKRSSHETPVKTQRPSQQKRRRVYRRSYWDMQTALSVLIGVVLVGVIIFFAFHLFATSTDTAGTTSSVNNNANSSSSNNSTNLGESSNSACRVNQQGQQQGQCTSSWWTNPDFQNAAEPLLFQALHLTKDQVIAQIQQGSGLTAIAQKQGISQSQWYQVEYNAAKAGFDTLVSKNELPVEPLASEPDVHTAQDTEEYLLKDIKTKGLDTWLEQMFGISIFDLPGGLVPSN